MESHSPRGASPPLRPATPVLADTQVLSGSAKKASSCSQMEADLVAGQKRKAGRDLERQPSNRFRIVSQLVIAMQRLQGAAYYLDGPRGRSIQHQP
jgi:hypothetical protein